MKDEGITTHDNNELIKKMEKLKSKKNIDYDNLLDQWFDIVMKQADESQLKSEEEYDKNPYSFRQGYLKGYAHGLIMATSILSNCERKARRQKKIT